MDANMMTRITILSIALVAGQIPSCTLHETRKYSFLECDKAETIEQNLISLDLVPLFRENTMNFPATH